MPRPVARPLPPRPVVSLPRWIIAAGSLMILVMGGLVLVIVLAMLLPIFELNQLVK